LQADGYAGFNRLYDSGTIKEAACWAHYPDSNVIQSSASKGPSIGRSARKVF
jgi:transposase